MRDSYSGLLSILILREFGFNDEGLPATEKPYHFKELYIDIIIRNPKNAGLSGYC